MLLPFNRALIATLLLLCSIVSFSQTTIYSTNFNSADEGWTNSGANNWVRGNSDFISGADGNYWAYPNTGGGYGVNAQALITSPTIDLSNYFNLTLSIDLRYDTEATWDGFTIEYSDDAGANWFTLGSTTEGTNWFNDTDVFALGNITGWSGDNTEWETATISLPSVLNGNSDAQLRLTFQSDDFINETGAAFDNVIITGDLISSAYATPSGAGVPGDASEYVLLWLRSDSSLVNDGTNVLSWGDFSGNNNHANAGVYPSYSSGSINGYDAVSFDGTDDYLDLGDVLNLIPTTDEWSFFSVFNIGGGNTGTLLARAGATGVDRQYQYGVTGDNFFTIQGGAARQDGSNTATGQWNLGSSITNTSSVDQWLSGATDITSGTIGGDTETQNVIIGARTGGTGFLLNGEIAEIIMFNGAVSTAKRRDIETYFAIKYGLTLDIATQDYTVNGSSIFDNTNFSSYNSDIAGIGLDNSQSLSQTSSINATGGIVTISNASSLDDGDFMVWGNDAGAITTTTSDIPSGVDERLSRIWRVAETNDVGTVDIAFNLTALGISGTTFKLLTAPSITTIPTGLTSATASSAGTVSIVNGDQVVTFSGVDLNDQEYFTLGVSSSVPASTGSASLSLWLRADFGITSSGGTVSSWTDQSGSGNDASQATGADQPTIVDNAINGNPILDFDGADDLDGSAGFNTQEYFVVVQPDVAIDGSANGFVVGFETGEFGGFYFGDQTDGFVGPNERVVHAIGDSGDPDDYRAGIETGTLSSADEPLIFSVRNDTGPTDTEIGLNGTDLTVDDTFTGNPLINLTNQAFRLGNNFLDDNGYDGGIAEVISYDERLSDAERRDVETYLAVKYGITLDISSSSYTVAGSAIYDHTTHGSYSNDIAGIGANESQGLSQTTSSSISGSGLLTISNASSLEDGDYLVWGHDNGALTTTTANVPTGVTNRVTRIWRVDETNDVGTVDLSFDITLLGLPSNAGYQLIVAATGSTMPTDLNGGTVITGGTVSNNILTFTGVTLNDGEYFTLGVDDLPFPGDVSGNIAVWLDASNGVTLNGSNISSWEDLAGTNDATQATANNQPEFVSSLLNGNPALYFDGGDIISGAGGFYTEENFIVVQPSEIYNSGASAGTIIGYDAATFARFGLGPTSVVIDDEIITYSVGTGGYRGGFVSTTTDLNQPALINPRENAGATGHEIYLNGATVTITEENPGSYQNLDNVDYDIGDESNAGTNVPYDGYVAEVISYSGRLSDDNRRSVATYLAIKYGLTLDITSQNYRISGTDIYSATGYANDIAGIALDESSNLNQQTSSSVNTGTIVEMSSASDLEDDEYLVWGNNGGNNDFTTSNAPVGTLEILEKIWTVDETGGDGVGTVSVSFDVTSLGIDVDNSTFVLVTLGSGFTAPDDFDTNGSTNASYTQSQVDGRDIITFTGVDFTDGDFFTLGGDIQTTSPGGTGLSMWLRADAGITESSNLVSSWADQSGNGNDVTQGNTLSQPLLSSNEINYNDALQFSDDNLEFTDGFYTQDYFIVVKPDIAIDNTTPIGYPLGFETGATTGFYVGDLNIIGNDLFGQTLATASYDVAATTASISNSNVVVFNSRNTAGSAQELYANGTSFAVTDNAGTFTNLNDAPIRIGNTFNNDNFFEGYIAEVISYSGRLGDTERRDVESYLALKYGVTLDISTENYTSDGVDLFTYTGHDFDIAGLGKHLDVGLDQTQSASVNDGVIVKMEGLSDLGDDEYLIWGYDGDTGGSKTTPDTNEKPASFDERLPAEWRVAVTGSPGTVTVKFYVGNITNFSERPQTASLYSLLIDDNDDFSVITSSVSASSLANDTLTFNNVSFTNGDRFTLALASQPVVTGLTMWLRADTEVEEASANDAENNDLIQFWRDQSGNNNDVSQNTFATRPTFNTGQLNGNPVVTFDDGDTYLDLVANANLNPRSIFVVYNDASSDANTTAFTNDDAGEGNGIGYGGTTNLFDATNTPADVRNGDNFVDGTDIGDGTSQARPANYELHSRVFASNLSNNTHNYFVGNDRGNSGTSIGGGVAEILVYTSALSNTERRDVETYLALKYGITLDISSLDYTYDGGTSIYDNATYSSYANDIAGIGSNSAFAFSQTSSATNNSDAIVTISNPTTLASEDFLIWGNDDGATTETATTVPPGVGMRVERIWGVNETNDIGTVTVAFNLGAPYSSKDVSDFTLFVDNNADFSDGLIRTYTAQSFTSNIVTFTGVDFTSAVNFGLGTTIDLVADGDTDGIPDYFESAYGTNASSGDSPVSGGSPNTDNSTVNGVLNDGISDALESILVTNGATGPITIYTDTDGDGIPDHIEVTDGSDPYLASSPTASGNSDSDSDGIPDGLEALITSEGGSATPALNTDSDSDGIPDWYEVMNGSDPGDPNSPTASGGGDSDADGISNALEAQLVSGGATAPIEVDTDTDGDGIPDYIEAQTFSDPFNAASPGAPGTPTVRTLQADYVASGGTCTDVSGYQWIDFSDNLGNLVFSINPVGNNLGSTCWGVRILDGELNVRDEGVNWVLNRNWYITPTTQPTSTVYVRFYSLTQENTDLWNELQNDLEDPGTLDDFNADSIKFTKISGVEDLDPFVTGGTRELIDPVVTNYSTNGKSLTIGISSFSTFVAHFNPGSPDATLPVELVDFYAEIDDEQVTLFWSTASELNNDFFVLERSIDGEIFQPIGTIQGAGTTNEIQNYRLTDPNPVNGLSYYRLKQVDYDGTTAFSKLVQVDYYAGLEGVDVLMYPNPANEFVNVSVDATVGNLELRIIDQFGRTVTGSVEKNGNLFTLGTSHLNTGIYLVEVDLVTQVKKYRLLINR